jgi:hypothetical protein
VSPWHDVALRNDDGTLNFVCEIPKDTWAKFEVATVHLSTHADLFCWNLGIPCNKTRALCCVLQDLT